LTLVKSGTLHRTSGNAVLCLSFFAIASWRIVKLRIASRTPEFGPAFEICLGNRVPATGAGACTGDRPGISAETGDSEGRESRGRPALEAYPLDAG